MTEGELIEQRIQKLEESEEYKKLVNQRQLVECIQKMEDKVKGGIESFLDTQCIYDKDSNINMTVFGYAYHNYILEHFEFDEIPDTKSLVLYIEHYKPDVLIEGEPYNGDYSGSVIHGLTTKDKFSDAQLQSIWSWGFWYDQTLSLRTLDTRVHLIGNDVVLAIHHSDGKILITEPIVILHDVYVSSIRLLDNGGLRVISKSENAANYIVYSISINKTGEYIRIWVTEHTSGTNMHKIRKIKLTKHDTFIETNDKEIPEIKIL